MTSGRTRRAAAEIAAHSVKGAAGNVGADALAHAAGELEKALRLGDDVAAQAAPSTGYEPGNYQGLVSMIFETAAP